MIERLRVVFDCNFFVQALAVPSGPAGRCVQMALAGQIALYFSPVVLDEIRRVTSYPKLVAKFRLNTTRVSTLLENLPKVAIIVPIVPKLWKYDRDPVTRITSISHLPRMPDLLFPEMRTYLIL